MFKGGVTSLMMLEIVSQSPPAKPAPIIGIPINILEFLYFSSNV